MTTLINWENEWNIPRLLWAVRS